MKDLARESMGNNAVVCNSMILVQNLSSICMEGEQLRPSILYLPVPNKGFVYLNWELRLYSRVYKEADLLRKSIVDPRLPDREELIGGDIFDGGRNYNARLLGTIRYTDALPELVEVATHDTIRDMRCSSLESIRMMGRGARKCATQIIKILQFDRSINVRKAAAQALGEIGNTEIIPELKEQLEDARRRTAQYYNMGWLFMGTEEFIKLQDTGILFEHLLEALIKLDRKAGMEEFKKSFEYDSNVLNFFSGTDFPSGGGYVAKHASRAYGMSEARYLSIPFESVRAKLINLRRFDPKMINQFY
jgi:hypothetical protein